MRWFRRLRRTDDMTADQIEEFFGSLPRMNRSQRRLIRLTLFVLLFAIASNLILAHRTEVQQNQIRDAAGRDRHTAYEQCQLVNANARALNGLIDKVILRVEQSTLPDAEKAQAVRLYTSSKQALPVCEKP